MNTSNQKNIKSNDEKTNHKNIINEHKQFYNEKKTA